MTSCIVPHLLEDFYGLEGAIQLSQLLQLQLLEVVIVARHINATLDDGLDLSKRRNART